MLHELQKHQFWQVLPLFHGYLQDPMMHAAIEGRSKGRVYVDDPADPEAAFVWTGTECAYVVGGQDNLEFLRALHELAVEEIMPAAKSDGRDYLSLFSFPRSYATELESLFSDQIPLRTPLCTFSFDEDTFLSRHFAPPRQMAGAAALKRIGKEELAKPENSYLAGEIAVYWGSIDSFLEDGTGFGALEGENLVSWCYVQAYGQGSQTIDIWTAPGHRRQGLGTLVAAAVIAKSLSDGYAPFWICDKANVASRRLAEGLGFQYTGDIFLVDVPFEPYSFYCGLAEHFFLPQGECRQAAEAYDRAFSVQQGEAQDYYRAAVSWSLAGDRGRALKYLQKAIDTGWKDMERVASEPAFAALREAT
ncbi:MAG: GNAT family N-acetyltransferase [Anaerolineae bacterium]|jgi:RimJ/RimL family protein N-acetyltransferase